MIKANNVKALLLTFCAVGVLTAANQTWADSTISNCAQVTATTETDTDSQPNSVASQADLLAAFTGSTLQDDESCAPLMIESIYDFGDAPDTYGTTIAGTGAQHEIIPGLLMGASVDEEADGQPGAGADADGTDEDGVSGLTSLQDGQAVKLQVTATNELGQDAYVGCWIDYDHSGTFDAGEYGGAIVPVGSTDAAISVTMPAVPADASTTMTDGTYARCRLSTDTMDASKATGLMTDGEVEDYKVSFTATPEFDLALVKRLADGQSGSVKPGDTVVFTIEVMNQGTIDATDIVLTDYIPSGLTLNDTAWTDNGNGTATLTTPMTSLAAGASTTVNVTFTVATDATAGDINNAAEITSAKDDKGADVTDIDSTPDNDPVNEKGVTDDVVDNSNGDEDDHDIALLTITVDPKVDIELVKTVTDTKGDPITTVRRGTDVVYVLTATNKGPDNATGVVVKDQLPAGLEYKSDDSASAYNSATGAWTVGDLANGESKVLKITATIK